MIPLVSIVVDLSRSDAMAQLNHIGFSKWLIFVKRTQAMPSVVVLLACRPEINIFASFYFQKNMKI